MKYSKQVFELPRIFTTDNGIKTRHIALITIQLKDKLVQERLACTPESVITDWEDIPARDLNNFEKGR